MSDQLLTHDQLLNEHSLSDTSTSEEPNLSATSIRCQQVDDLDTSNEHFSGCRLLNELWCISVNRKPLAGLDGSSFVNGITSDVHDTTECAWSDGNHDGRAGVGCDVATSEALGTCRSCQK
jgi:hypothetical protein